jgi:hypothetical protein
VKLALYADSDGVAKEIKIKSEARGRDLILTSIEVPEFESLAEFSNIAPNEKAVVDFVNDAVRNKKLQKIRAQLLAIPKEADLDVAFDQIREQAKNHDVFTTAERASAVNKVKAASFDKLEAAISRAASEGRELSLAELQELMAQAL